MNATNDRTMTYAATAQADYDAARAAYSKRALSAVNAMPPAVYLNDERRQAWFCGWHDAATV